MKRTEKLAAIANTIAPGFLEATKGTGHTWQRDAKTGAVACTACGASGKKAEATQPCPKATP